MKNQTLTFEERQSMSKRGMSQYGQKVEVIIGVVLTIVLIVALAPTIFGNDTGIGGLDASVPAWFKATLLVVVPVVLLLMILKGK